MVLQLFTYAAAAPLPMSLRWIESIVPPAVVGPALNMYFQNLPKELCAMGPDAIGNVPPIATNQVRQLGPFRFAC
jgi:hypothetical protein